MSVIAKALLDWLNGYSRANGPMFGWRGFWMSPEERGSLVHETCVRFMMQGNGLHGDLTV